MKRYVSTILVVIIFIFMGACGSNVENQLLPISAKTIGVAVNETLSAIPYITPTSISTETSEKIEDTPLIPTETTTQLSQLAPLYYELEWVTLGPMDQEMVIDIDGKTNEKVLLSGIAYKAAMPPGKDDFVNRIHNYYYKENMLAEGWIMINGWGGVDGTIIEYFNNSGYFLTVRINNKQPSSIIVWISNWTSIIPIIP